MPEDPSLKPAEWDFWRDFLRAHDDLCRELEGALQRDFGISKADFSVMSSLNEAPEQTLRIGQLAEALGWDKGRVAHQASRMETRGLLRSLQAGPRMRRVGVTLTSRGEEVLRGSQSRHGDNIRRLFLEGLTPSQARTLREWSSQTVERMGALSKLNSPGPRSS